MEVGILSYEHASGRRWRPRVWLLIVLASVVASIGAATYLLPHARGRPSTPARGTDVVVTAMSLSSQLQRYAQHHDDRLPESIDDLVAEGYYSAGVFRRLADSDPSRLVYAGDHRTGPIRFEYCGAGVSTRSEGAAVFRCMERDYTVTYITAGAGQCFRPEWAMDSADGSPVPPR